MNLHKIATRNPELARNIWLEISPTRLIVAPLIILALVYMLSNGREFAGINTLYFSASILGVIIFCLFTLVWGSKQVASSVSDEVRENTWDFQRISSISPMQMMIGKLFGSTIYMWYIGVLSISVYLYSAMQLDVSVCASIRSKYCHNLIESPILNIATIVTITLFFHGIMLINSIRFKDAKRTSSIVLLLALILFAPAILAIGTGGLATEIQWYHITFSGRFFGLCSLIIFTGWIFVAAHRLMRQEFQHTNYPWVWTSFIIFINVYFMGFAFRDSYSLIQTDKQMFLAFFITSTITYYTLFEEKKDFVQYKKWWRDVRSRNFSASWLTTPRWLISYGFCFFSVILILITQNMTQESNVFKENQALKAFSFAVALLLFMARDIIILHYCHAKLNGKRQNLTAIFFLIILYSIMPALVATMSAKGSSLNLFYPSIRSINIASIISATLQCIFFGLRLYNRLKSNTLILDK